ncbi:MAG: phytoene/squalene synthase family protein [Actinomycetota bacterium]|nr:phytoene/squalene synthase family protein [Actinomycetota bacterium]
MINYRSPSRPATRLAGIGPHGIGPPEISEPVISEPEILAPDARASLDRAYQACRVIHRTHGRSYYLATRLLPPWKRRHVHALYALTRYTDDIVDAPRAAADEGHADEAARRLEAWTARFYATLDSDAPAGHPVVLAACHTIAEFGLDHADFDAFFTSMAMDLRIREYASYDALLSYMDGSAAVIGTMTLPVLLAGEDSRRPASAEIRAGARETARQLGLAFQLTNFLRDVAEDLSLGRVYLPLEDLERFGVRRADLGRPSASPAVRRLIAFEIDRARSHYRQAAPGVALLPPRSRRCVRLAFAVYGAILTRIERAGYDVLAGRVVVPQRQRVAAVVRELTRPA